VKTGTGMIDGRTIIDGFYENRQRSFPQKQGLIQRIKGGKR